MENLVFPFELPGSHRSLQPRTRRKKGQEYMCRFDVWHKNDPALRSTVTARTASQARRELCLRMRTNWPDIKYIDIRSSLSDVLYPIAGKVPAHERQILEIMRHALGLKDYIGEGTEFRNHYCISAACAEFPLLKEACISDVPLMYYRSGDALASGMVIFHVTAAGKAWVNERIGMSTDTRN